MRRYNRAHRKPCVKIECAIGVLKARFLCLSRKASGPLLFSPEVASIVISTCCCSHNIARRRGLPDPENLEVEEEEEQPARGENERRGASEETRRRLIETRFTCDRL